MSTVEDIALNFTERDDVVHLTSFFLFKGSCPKPIPRIGS